MSSLPANVLGAPTRPLLPAQFAAQRIQLTSYLPTGSGYSVNESAEFDRVCMAVTTMIERAVGRGLVRRPNVMLVFDGAEIGWENGRLAPLELEAARPIEQIHNLWIDVAHDDPVDVVFDATTLIDPANYRLEGPPSHAIDFGGWRLWLRADAHPQGFGVANVRLEATFGYEPKSTAIGYVPPANAPPMPADLEEAMVRQVSIVWQRRANLHMSSQSVSTPGGAGTTSYIPTRLSTSVREMILPYCTAEAALRLNIPDAIYGGGQE